MPYPSMRRASKRLLAACWLMIGLVCIPLDGFVQPMLTELGQQPWLRAIVERWQDLGSNLGIVLFLGAGLSAWPADRAKTVLRFVACVATVGIAAQIIKYAAGRARPHSVNDATWFFGPFGVFNWGDTVPIDSMPSGHTAAAFAMATAIALRWPFGGWIAYPLAAGVGISRTLVDRHFPSDVILGSLLGTILATLVWNWSSKLEFNREDIGSSEAEVCRCSEKHQ